MPQPKMGTLIRSALSRIFRPDSGEKKHSCGYHPPRPPPLAGWLAASMSRKAHTTRPSASTWWFAMTSAPALLSAVASSVISPVRRSFWMGRSVKHARIHGVWASAPTSLRYRRRLMAGRTATRSDAQITHTLHVHAVSSARLAYFRRNPMPRGVSRPLPRLRRRMPSEGGAGGRAGRAGVLSGKPWWGPSRGPIPNSGPGRAPHWAAGQPATAARLWSFGTREEGSAGRGDSSTRRDAAGSTNRAPRHGRAEVRARLPMSIPSTVRYLMVPVEDNQQQQERRNPNPPPPPSSVCSVWDAETGPAQPPWPRGAGGSWA